MLRPVPAWVAILVLAVLNGVVREALLLPRFGRGAAYLSSGLVMTVIFEFGFGLLQHKPWPQILAPYAFADGNIWPLVLVVVLFAPWLAWRFRAAS
ncbi:MAG TPA: hypothetical protein VNU64_02675 [Burkholderiales bacterium]|nr:hypothetical protein [Burkholderiales bacterium]